MPQTASPATSAADPIQMLEQMEAALPDFSPKLRCIRDAFVAALVELDGTKNDLESLLVNLIDPDHVRRLVDVRAALKAGRTDDALGELERALDISCDTWRCDA